MSLKFDFLKKSRFTIVCGLVIIGLFGFFLLGIIPLWWKINLKREELQKETENIKNLIKLIESKGGVLHSSEATLQKYNEYYQKLETDEKRCLEYYKKADEVMENWFTDLRGKLEADGLPSDGAFYTNYGTERESLIKLLKAQNIGIGRFGEVGKEAELLGFKEPDPKKRPEYQLLQKRFWIQQRIIKAISNSKVTRCESINFTPPEAKNMPTQIQVLPGGIIPVSITVYLHYKDIPHFIWQLTDVSQGGFLMEVKEINISRLIEELNEYPEIKRPEIPPEITQKDTWQPASIVPPLVKLFLLCGVYDFDIK